MWKAQQNVHLRLEHAAFFADFAKAGLNAGQDGGPRASCRLKLQVVASACPCELQSV